MKCQRCKSERVLSLSAKCSDLCVVTWPDGREEDGYVPELPNLGGGDYVEFKVCLACGQVQGKWPVKGGRKA
jgi:hypothetical protein